MLIYGALSILVKFCNICCHTRNLYPKFKTNIGLLGGEYESKYSKRPKKGCLSHLG